MKQQKWITMDGDIDFKEVVRCINKPLNKKNYKLLDRYCRKNTYRSHCGHEWDCCGCVSSVTTWMTYQNTNKYGAPQIAIYQRVNFNY
jgi:hypothetical protein